MGRGRDLGIVHLREQTGGSLKRVYSKSKGEEDLKVEVEEGLPYNVKPGDHLDFINSKPKM